MPRFCANLTLLFGEVPFLDRFAAAAEMGFAGVEFLYPYQYDKVALRELLDRHRLQLALFNAPPGDWDGGECGTACLPDRRGEFEAGVEQAIDYARALNCPRVNCLAGIAPPGSDPVLTRKTLVQNLRFAAGRAAAAGIELVLEPINNLIDRPGYCVNRSADALAVIDETGAGNLKLQYDVYHMQIMEGNLTPTLRRHVGRIGHVQIADHPGRHEPGTGEINFGFVFQCLDQCGYAGWVGCEYVPKADTYDSLRWLGSARPRALSDG